MNERRTYRSALNKNSGDDDEPATGGLSWCFQRSGWFFGFAGGVVALFHAAVIAALIVAALAYVHADYSLTQVNHYQNGRLECSPLAHVMGGTTPLVLTLPNDLSAYVGRVYQVDCVSALAHTVVIEPGSAATWTAGTPNIRTATCLSAGGGFGFRVVSATGIRLIDPRDVSFT
jgi:hypothetical protein